MNATVLDRNSEFVNPPQADAADARPECAGPPRARRSQRYPRFGGAQHPRWRGACGLSSSGARHVLEAGVFGRWARATEREQMTLQNSPLLWHERFVRTRGRVYDLQATVTRHDQHHYRCVDGKSLNTRADANV